MAPLTYKHQKAIYKALDISTTGLILVTVADSYTKNHKLHRRIAQNGKRQDKVYVKNSNNTLNMPNVIILKKIHYTGVKDKMPMTSYFICYDKNVKKLKNLLNIS